MWHLCFSQIKLIVGDRLDFYVVLSGEVHYIIFELFLAVEATDFCEFQK
jgi:hypothetical protein